MYDGPAEAAVRRLATVLIVATATAVGLLYWLHDGDLRDAVAPVMPTALPDWDADRLARAAGLDRQAEPAASPPPTATTPPPIGAVPPTGLTEADEGDRP